MSLVTVRTEEEAREAIQLLVPLATTAKQDPFSKVTHKGHVYARVVIAYAGDGSEEILERLSREKSAPKLT